MTSFELFKLLKFKKNLHFTYIFILFLLKYNLCDKLLHFMKKKNKQYLVSNYGIIPGFKIKLCKKSCRKEKWAGLKNLICINFKCLELQFGFEYFDGVFSNLFLS